MGVVCVWRGNSLTFVILSIWMDGSFQFCIWKKAIIIHHWSFLIHHSSFVIHEILNHSSSIIRHSSFIIHHSSSIIIHHSALIIVHSAGIICHSLFQKSMKNRWESYEKSIKNGAKINAKATKIGLGTPLEPSWSCPGVQDPFKSEQLNFALTLERNGHSGEKWWFRSRVRAGPKIRPAIENRIYHKS